jgi:hypothetical protein
MKPALMLLALVSSEAAFAQDATSCRLLSEDKYARVAMRADAFAI